MLYDQWQKTLSTHGDTLAVSHAATGEQWRFLDLQTSLDQLSPLKSNTLHIAPISSGIFDFILQTLRAWRDHAVLCPMEKEPGDLNLPLPLPDGIAHVKLTSGSTGTPRCVMLRTKQLAADAENIRRSMKLNVASPNLAVISAAHSYGFSNLILPLLLQGHPLVIASDALPGSLRKAFELGHRFTLPAVPAMWRAWYRTGLLQKAPIDLAISAGAPLPIELEQDVYTECGLKIHNFYGSSECGGIAYDGRDIPREEASYAGENMHGVSLAVNDDGCLVIQSEAVAEGYWPVTEENVLHEGRFTTTDQAQLKGSDVYLLGRMTDAINVAGRKLNPQDVESALMTFPSVKHCVVFGIPSSDPDRCEEPVACINATSEITSDDLIHWLGDKLAMWQRPRRFWFSHELAPDERGKTPRRIWREKFLEQAHGERNPR